MRKKVVFKTNSFPNASETFIVNSIVETIKNGFDVEIIVDKINSSLSTSQIDLLDQYDLMNKVSVMEFPQTKKCRTIRAFFLLLNPILFFYYVKYLFWKKKKSLQYIFILSYFLKFRKIDVFHIHFATAINPLLDLKEIGFFKKPNILVTFHGYDAFQLLSQEKLNSFNKNVFAITVNSTFLKDKLISKGFDVEKIKVIPIGIDTNYFSDVNQKKFHKKPFKIITVGRLEVIKGQSLGMDVIKFLKDKGYSVEYNVVGGGKELDYLIKKTIDLGIVQEVNFYGVASQNEVKELLADSHLFMMTSTMDKNMRSEAFGVVSLEAQSMGLPIVGFNTGGFPETILLNETGLVVSDKDVVALAQEISGLIDDVKKIEQLSINAKNHIRNNFTIDLISKKYFNLYYR